MKSDRRARLVALHRWAGLVGGWLLFAVFLWGTISVYDAEITSWMEPEIRTVAADPIRGAEVAERLLRSRASDEPRWIIELPGPRSGRVAVSWSGGPDGSGAIAADAVTGRLARATRGGDLFYGLHYGLLLGAPGEIVVGLAGLVLLTLIASGVLIHLRRLLPDLLTLRLHGSAARTLRDAHVLTGVAVLPFLATFAYSGVLVFAFVTLPTTVWSRYPHGGLAYFADLGATLPVATTVASTPVSDDGALLSAAVRTAQRAFGGAEAGWMIVAAPADPARRRISVTERDGAVLALRRDTAVIDGRTGALLRLGPTDDSGPVRAARLLYGIHFANWGGPTVRALYAASGALGTISIGVALALFGAARRRRAVGTPLPVADRLSLAATVGLLDACLAPFWANRLLSASFPYREAGENGALLVVWTLALVTSLIVRRHPARPLLAAGTVLGTVLPLLDVLTAPIGAQPLLHVMVDGVIFLVALAMATAFTLTLRPVQSQAAA